MNNIASSLYHAARQSPNSIALSCEGRSLRFAELETLVGQMRRFIERSSPVRKPPGDSGHGGVAAILACQGVESVAFAQAALRCGLACTFIDPRFPAQRIAAILNDCQPCVLYTELARPRLQDLLGAAVLPPTLFADASADAALALPTAPTAAPHSTLAEVQTWEPERQAPLPVAADAPACLFYTSHASGKPVALRASQRALRASIDPAHARFAFAAQDVFLTAAHSSCDCGCLCPFIAWEVGASVVLVPETSAAFAVHLVDLVREQGVTTLWLTPFQLNAMVRQGGLLEGQAGCIRHIFFGGDAMALPTLRALHGWMAGRPLYALCGPAEAPLRTVELVCAEELQALAAGGRSRASGPQGPDGPVAGQVWVRGLRVELDDVRHALTALPGVDQAAVWLHAPEAGPSEIHALCVAHNTSERNIRWGLAQWLPSYMVPRRFHFVDALPEATQTAMPGAAALPGASVSASANVNTSATPVLQGALS